MVRRLVCSSWFAVSLVFFLVVASGCGDDLPAAGPDGGGGGGPDAGPPFDVAQRHWTFVPIDGNVCANGSGTGIGLNLDFSSDKLVVFLEGGGACFNPLSCSMASHQGGFGPGDLDGVATATADAGILSRTDPDNPVADWSYVFIPYCEGDIHAGDTDDGPDGRTMHGYGNVTRAVTAVADAYQGRLSRVLLVGQSAGGFGAGYNYDQVAEIFGEVPVDLVDDSGPPMSDTYLTPCFQTQLRQVWNLGATLPPDCDDCIDQAGGGFANLAPFLANKYPERRFGFISSLHDQTIRLFYGFGYPDCDNPVVPMEADVFEAGVTELRDVIVAPLANARAYTIDSDVHVWTNQPLGQTEVAGVTLGTWLGQLLDGSADWSSITPPPAAL